MPVVPEGLPAHARASSIDTFGGHVDKQNYAGIGIVDPRTDESAEAFSRAVDILQAVEKTAPFMVITYDNEDTGATDPTIVSRLSMYGGDPTLERISDGYVTVTFESTYDDSYGVEQGFSISNIDAYAHGLGAVRAGAVITDSQTVTVACVDTTDGSAVTDARVTLRVW